MIGRLLSAVLLLVTGSSAAAGSWAAQATPDLTPFPAVSSLAAPSKVLVVVLENHPESTALRAMPYLAAQARRFGYTTAYRAVTHPSLPNYLSIAGGSTFGVTDDASPASHHLAGLSVFDQAIAAHRTAKTYAEAMPGACSLVPRGRYAVKHNPWAYFSGAAQRAACRRFDVPAGTTTRGALLTDVRAGTLPSVGLVVPDLCHDGHDCPLSTTDAWLHGWLPVVMAGPDFRTGRLTVVVTFDEGVGTAQTVLTVVMSQHTRGVRSTTAYSHYSLTRYVDDLLHLPLLRTAARAHSLRPAFGI